MRNNDNCKCGTLSEEAKQLRRELETTKSRLSGLEYFMENEKRKTAVAISRLEVGGLALYICLFVLALVFLFKG